MCMYWWLWVSRRTIIWVWLSYWGTWIKMGTFSTKVTYLATMVNIFRSTWTHMDWILPGPSLLGVICVPLHLLTVSIKEKKNNRGSRLHTCFKETTLTGTLEGWRRRRARRCRWRGWKWWRRPGRWRPACSHTSHPQRPAGTSEGDRLSRRPACCSTWLPLPHQAHSGQKWLSKVLCTSEGGRREARWGR